MQAIFKLENGEELAREILAQVEGVIREFGLRPDVSKGKSRIMVGAIGEIPTGLRDTLQSRLEGIPGVAVSHITTPYKLVSREYHKRDTVVTIDGKIQIGGGKLVLMAGPCAVEGRDECMSIFENIFEIMARIGIKIQWMFRGGAFKPRTSPHSGQGLKEMGLRILQEIYEQSGIPIVTEATRVLSLQAVAEVAQMIQIGTRNFQNFELLEAVARVGKPIFYKRGMSAYLDEWLLGAEYLLNEGNPQVVLCERGIRTMSQPTRNTLDLGILPIINEKTHLPVIVEPSHATGVRSCVARAAYAAIAVGADGIMVEVHDNPSRAMSDGKQSLLPEQFEEMVKRIADILPWYENVYAKGENQIRLVGNQAA